MTKTLADYFQPRNVKRAEGPTDPGPDSGHPASVESGTTIPSGETAANAVSMPKELVGDKAVVDGTGGSEKEKKPQTLETTVGTIESIPTEPVASTVTDLGEDSHPASSGEKFASCETTADVLRVMQKEIDQLISKIAALPDNDEQPQSRTVTTNEQLITDPVAKVASILEQVLTGSTPEATASIQFEATKKVASLIGPIVEEAVEYADQLVRYIKLAEIDPQAAAELVGGDPAAMGGDPAAMPMDPAAMGGDPAAMGGDPAAMGGDPAAGIGGGGEVTEEALLAAISQLAQDMGISEDELIAMLAEEAGSDGGGAPGLPQDASAGGLESVGGAESVDAPAAAPSADPAAEMQAADALTDKTSAAPQKYSKLAAIASKLAAELNLGPTQVAKACKV